MKAIKKISELEKLTELVDSSNVIIEENGVAKLFPATNIGKVKTVNGIAPDSNGNIEIEVSNEQQVWTQANWNENDINANGYIKNRPFYETDTIICVDNLTISGFEVMEEPIYTVHNQFNLSFNEGAEYIIDWDGNRYTATCVYLSEDEAYVIGNENYFTMQSGGDYPFAIIGIEGNILVATESTAEQHTITIIQSAYIKKIDEKFLPNINNGNGGGASSWNDLTDKPFYPPTIYYEWNEDTVYETRVALPEGGYAGYLAKISDDSPSSDYLIGKYLNAAANVNGETQTQAAPITSNLITSGEGYYTLANILFVVSAASADVEGMTLTKGIWCIDDWDESQTDFSYLYIQIYDEGKTIDESVIPDTIARTSDLEHYTYGTEDLTVGVSELATGMLYFVYE